MDIYVHVIDFQNSIPCVSAKNDDGSYSIFVNDRITGNRRLRAYKHEISHISNDDFSSHDKVDDIEAERHNER